MSWRHRSGRPDQGAHSRPARQPAASSAATEVISEAAQPETNGEVAGEVAEKAEKSDKKRPARARKPKAEAKPVDLAEVGLQLVETKADAPKAAVAVEEEKPRKPRKAASWQKQTKEESTAEPLVMVETQNK